MINSSMRYLLSDICYPEPAHIGSYTPSLDVYGSYFPAWLICLMDGGNTNHFREFDWTSLQFSHDSSACSFGAD